MNVKIIYGIFLFLGSITLSSCHGQSKKNTNQPETSETAIGKNESKLPINAHLLYQDRQNNYWFRNDNGIYRFDGKRLIRYTTQDGLVSHRILEVQEDKLGNIYFDTPDGVSKYEGQQFTTLEVTENNAKKNEWKLEPDDLWFRIGWEHNGPFRYDGKHLYALEFPKSMIEDDLYEKYPNISYNPYSIFSMFKDSRGAVWFGTSDLGVYRYDGHHISWMHEAHLGTMPGGGSFGIRSIAEDKDGYFWICNTNYKYKVLPDRPLSSELIPMNYKREIGISGDEDDAQYFMDIKIDNNGNLWLTNQDGIWQSDGNEINQFYIQEDGKDISPKSVYEDNQGVLWFGTEKHGMYKYDGKSFEKFEVD